MKRMNVTPKEFSELHEWAAVLPEKVFEHMVHMYYGVPYFQKTKIVVRTDVSSIPWYTKNVERFENES